PPCIRLAEMIGWILAFGERSFLNHLSRNRGLFQRNMTPQHMILIDTVLTLPGATIEAEYQRRIAAINAVIAFCDVEECAPTRPGPLRKRPATDAVAPYAKRQERSQEDEDTIALRQAIASIRVHSL
ncbi:hypothetical protein T310_9911, partial [Rasamsonia emersonii CBS 393.64]